METTLAVRTIQDALPASWAIELDGNTGPDLTITSQSGGRLSFSVYTNRAGALPVPELIAVLEQRRQQSGQPVLYLSNYIGPTARKALVDAQFNFADETGWIYLLNDNPMLFLDRQGAAKAPKSSAPNKAQIVRLNGKGASRLICALAMAEPPIGVRDLARLAGVSPGTATKILTALTTEGIVERNSDKQIAKIYRRALIERWVQDYQFLKDNAPLGLYIARRGILNTFQSLQEERNIAFTGSAAAQLLLPEGTSSIVPMMTLAVYSNEPAALANKYRLIPASITTYDTVIATPLQPSIIDSDWPSQNAPIPLVLADLLTLPNRGDAEFNQLIDELFPNDTSWSVNDGQH